MISPDHLYHFLHTIRTMNHRNTPVTFYAKTKTIYLKPMIHSALTDREFYERRLFSVLKTVNQPVTLLFVFLVQ